MTDPVDAFCWTFEHTLLADPAIRIHRREFVFTSLPYPTVVYTASIGDFHLSYHIAGFLFGPPSDHLHHLATEIASHVARVLQHGPPAPPFPPYHRPP